MQMAMAFSTSLSACLRFPPSSSPPLLHPSPRFYALFPPPPSPLPLRSQPPPPPSAHNNTNTLLTVFLTSSAALGFLLHTFGSPDAAALAVSSSPVPPPTLHIPLDSDLRALALGPQGPLVEEFWENMRRYGLYFLTVASGGIYSLLEPLFALLKNPLTAILTIVVISGSFYLLYLTLNTMLGINAFDYRYS